MQNEAKRLIITKNNNQKRKGKIHHSNKSLTLDHKILK